MNIMSFYKNVSDLCAQRGISLTRMSSDLGFGSSIMTNWRKGSVPQNRTLKKIADYFGVSVESLTSDKQPAIVDTKPLDGYQLFSIPVFENVSAGFGAYANDNIVDYMPLPFKSETEAKESLVIHVVGDSMSPVINDGNFIQVRMQSSVDSGDIAVVLIDENEGFVKRVEYGANYINLISLNPLYPPRVFSNAEIQRVRVLGRIRKVITEF